MGGDARKTLLGHPRGHIWLFPPACAPQLSPETTVVSLRCQSRIEPSERVLFHALLQLGETPRLKSLQTPRNFVPAPHSGEREGEPGVLGGKEGTWQRFLPQLSLQAERSFLCQIYFSDLRSPSVAVLGGCFLLWVTRTPQSCPRNVAEPRGCAWVPEVAVAAGCCGFQQLLTQTT